MRILLLVLLLCSCSTNRKIIRSKDQQFKKFCKDVTYIQQMEYCMLKFAKLGYDSEGIVKICSKIYERRK